jgi:hypothetical protein
VNALYRLQESLLSLKLESKQRPGLQILPVGTLFVVVSSVRKLGFIDILVNGDLHTVFLTDIQERGEVVEESKGASACA